jgi:hypothetical protein
MSRGTLCLRGRQERRRQSVGIANSPCFGIGFQGVLARRKGLLKFGSRRLDDLG